MSTDLGKAYVQIVPSANGISDAIKKTLGQEIDPAATQGGQSLGKKLGGFAIKAFAAMEVGKFIKNTIEEGARYEQAVGGIETMFKTSSDKMKAYANEAYKTAGISANDYMEQATSFSASLLQSLGGDTSKAAEAANQAIIDMSDNSAKFGTNIADIQHAYQGFAKQNYTMLDNLKLGYGGTKTEMERLLADAEKLSGKKYDISNLSDVYEAIHVIQEEYGIAGTTALEGSATISGSFAQMQSAAQNFMAQLVAGEDIEGAMNGLIDSAVTFAGNLLPALMTVLEQVPDAIGTLATNLTDKLQNEEARAKMIEAAKNFMLSFGEGVIQNIPAVLEFLWELIKAIFQVLLETRIEMLQKIGDFMQTHLFNVIAEKFEIIKTGIHERVKAIVEAVLNFFVNMKNGVSERLELMKSAAQEKFQSMKANISGKVTEIVNTVKTKFSDAKNAISERMEAAKNKVKSIIDAIKGFFHFRVSWPHIPLPHFSIRPSGWDIGDLLKGSIPRLSVSWYAKGGIFNKPTVLSGLGDAGPEAALPLDTFWDRLDNWGASIIDGMAVVASGMQDDKDITVVTYLYPNGPKMDEYTYKSYNRGKARLGDGTI